MKEKTTGQAGLLDQEKARGIQDKLKLSHVHDDTIQPGHHQNLGLGFAKLSGIN